jgi:hypothetical protein
VKGEGEEVASGGEVVGRKLLVGLVRGGGGGRVEEAKVVKEKWMIVVMS